MQSYPHRLGVLSLTPLIRIAIVLLPTSLLITGLIILALFGRVEMRLAAMLSGIIFGISQGFLLWNSGMLSVGWSVVVGAIFIVAISSLLFLFIRKGRMS